MVFPSAITFAILSALSSITAIPHPANSPKSHPEPAGASLLPCIPADPPSFPIIFAPPISNSSTSPAANLDFDIHPILCFTSSYVPTITDPSDCGIALCELLASGQADVPREWGPIINSWTWGTCGLFLVAMRVRTSDTFSALQIAQEAQRIFAQCVTEAYGYRGGNARIGENEDFTLVVSGIRMAAER